MNIDIIDVKILEVLQENARVSVSELSKRVNLSLSAVSERLKKLDNSELIQAYTTIIKPEAMGYCLGAIMLVRLDEPGNTPDFVDFIKKSTEIIECYHITGDFDYCLKIQVRGTSELENVINSIKNVASVVRTQSNIILSTLKHNYSVSPVSTKD